MLVELQARLQHLEVFWGFWVIDKSFYFNVSDVADTQTWIVS